MQRDLVVKENPLLSAKLNRLGRTARQAHDRARKYAVKAVENIVRAGQKLCKARDICETDEWDTFLATYFKGCERTAQRYMKLARHWSELQAFAPPEALTSQRKAFRLLNALLAGEEPPSETARSKKQATSAVLALPAPPVPEPTSTPSTAVGDEWRIAAQQMHENILRVLEGLTKELSELSPPNYLVRQALAAIGRAYRRVADNGETLFRGGGES